MNCQACARALIGGPSEMREEIRVGRMKCAARIVARSDATKCAMDKSAPINDRVLATAEVRQLIAATMPGVPYEVARQEVLAWWKADQ